MKKTDLLEIKKQFKFPDASFSALYYGNVKSLEYEGQPHSERIEFIGSSKYMTRDEDEQKAFLSLLSKAFSYSSSISPSDVSTVGEEERLLKAFALSDTPSIDFDVLLSRIVECYPEINGYSVVLFKGSYDIPIKDESKTKTGESEDVFNYFALMVCPVKANKTGLSPDSHKNDIVKGLVVSQLQAPVFGMIYPSFTDRASDDKHAFVCCKGENERLLVSAFFSEDIPEPKKKETSSSKKFTLDDSITVSDFQNEAAADIVAAIKDGNVDDFKTCLKNIDEILSERPVVNNIDNALLDKRRDSIDEMADDSIPQLEIKTDKSVLSQDRITERSINGRKYFIVPADLLPSDLLDKLLGL